MSGGYNANDEIKLMDAVTLTALYTGNLTTGYEHRSVNGLTLLLKYAAHASSPSAYASVQVEVSYDNTNWIPYGEWTRPSTGIRQFESTTFNIVQSYPLSFLTLDEMRGRYFRIKAKETDYDTTNFGTLTVYAYTHTL
jgi:hypothetical protein